MRSTTISIRPRRWPRSTPLPTGVRASSTPPPCSASTSSSGAEPDLRPSGLPSARRPEGISHATSWGRQAAGPIEISDVPRGPGAVEDRRGLRPAPPVRTGDPVPEPCELLDSAFLMLSVPRRMGFVGKAEYMDSWKTKDSLPGDGHDPDRPRRRSQEPGCARGRRSGAAPRRAVRIFREGTRSRDGRLYKGRTGCCPIGAQGRLPDLPRRCRRDRARSSRLTPRCRSSSKSCSITIGRPILPERYRNRGDDHLVLRSIMDEVMYEIREMTGQEYRDVYTGKSLRHRTVRCGQGRSCQRRRRATAARAGVSRSARRPDHRRQTGREVREPPR